MQRYTVYFIWKLLYMFRVVPPPIIRSANNCIYSIWYLSHRYCYLPLSWKSWNRFECAVGGVRHILYSETLRILKCIYMATVRNVDTVFDKFKVFAVCCNGDYVPLCCVCNS